MYGRSPIDRQTAMLIDAVAANVERARAAVREGAYRTPLERSLWLSEITGADVRLKLECYQPVGSFKVRGALAAIANLDEEERARGVVTASAGNHGLGLAFAATRAGVQATVVVPENASSAKVSALRRFPIDLRFGGPSYDTAEAAARELEASTGMHFVSPYNDPWVIAGQGTIGVEMLEDAPDLDVALIPVGGGGLISGVGSWLKSQRPGVRIVGVQAESSPAMEQALRAGRLVSIPVLPTMADGLAANIEAGSQTFEIAREVVDEMVLISEAAMAAAMAEAFEELHLALEGSAAVGIAALTLGAVLGLQGKTVAVVITGRNVATERFVAALAGEVL